MLRQVLGLKVRMSMQVISKPCRNLIAEKGKVAFPNILSLPIPRAKPSSKKVILGLQAKEGLLMLLWSCE